MPASVRVDATAGAHRAPACLPTDGAFGGGREWA